MKKKLLALGSIAAITTPIAGVVACTPGSYKIIDLTDKDISYLTDGNSIADSGFNLAIGKALDTAKGSTIIDSTHTTGSLTDFYDKQIKAGKKLLVLGGFGHVAGLKAYAETHKEAKFVLVDSEVVAKNVASIKFSMREIGFIAGFRMAHYASDKAKNGIGIYGAKGIGPIQDYVQGILKGIEYYNNHGSFGKTITTVIPHNEGFTGSFDKNDSESIEKAKKLVQNSSLIVGVGGPKYKDIIKVIKEAKAEKTTKVVGIDFDIEVIIKDLNDKKLVWGSILKNITSTTKKVIDDMKEDYTEHLNELYTGDINNGGTGLVIGKDSLTKENNFGIIQGMLSSKMKSPEDVIAAATKFSKAII